jgi:hypothetical protein
MNTSDDDTHSPSSSVRIVSPRELSYSSKLLSAVADLRTLPNSKYFSRRPSTSLPSKFTFDQATINKSNQTSETHIPSTSTTDFSSESEVEEIANKPNENNSNSQTSASYARPIKNITEMTAEEKFEFDTAVTINLSAEQPNSAAESSETTQSTINSSSTSTTLSVQNSSLQPTIDAQSLLDHVQSQSAALAEAHKLIQQLQEQAQQQQQYLKTQQAEQSALKLQIDQLQQQTKSASAKKKKRKHLGPLPGPAEVPCASILNSSAQPLNSMMQSAMPAISEPNSLALTNSAPNKAPVTLATTNIVKPTMAKFQLKPILLTKVAQAALPLQARAPTIAQSTAPMQPPSALPGRAKRAKSATQRKSFHSTNGAAVAFTSNQILSINHGRNINPNNHPAQQLYSEATTEEHNIDAYHQLSSPAVTARPSLAALDTELEASGLLLDSHSNLMSVLPSFSPAMSPARVYGLSNMISFYSPNVHHTTLATPAAYNQHNVFNSTNLSTPLISTHSFMNNSTAATQSNSNNPHSLHDFDRDFYDSSNDSHQNLSRTPAKNSTQQRLVFSEQLLSQHNNNSDHRSVQLSVDSTTVEELNENNLDDMASIYASAYSQ